MMTLHVLIIEKSWNFEFLWELCLGLYLVNITFCRSCHASTRVLSFLSIMLCLFLQILFYFMY